MSVPEDRVTESSEGKEKESSFASLPSYPRSYEGLPDYPVKLLTWTEIPCDECEGYLAGTKSYSVVYVISLCSFPLFRVDTVLKCPRCMRRYLLVRLPVAVLLANLFAPLTLVWWAILFVRTFIR
jgi:hypothetical protein